MRVVRHPDVPQELEEAAAWYENRRAGLGKDFIDEYQATLLRILARPERWRKIRGENRKVNFDRFPYAIVYSVPRRNAFHQSRYAPAAPSVLLVASLRIISMRFHCW